MTTKAPKYKACACSNAANIPMRLFRSRPPKCSGCGLAREIPADAVYVSVKPRASIKTRDTSLGVDFSGFPSKPIAPRQRPAIKPIIVNMRRGADVYSPELDIPQAPRQPRPAKTIAATIVYPKPRKPSKPMAIKAIPLRRVSSSAPVKPEPKEIGLLQSCVVAFCLPFKALAWTINKLEGLAG